METKKRTQATDIAEIATKLDGKVKFSSIIYSQQMLSEKYRETGVNDMYFIGKKFGLWFYTSRAALDSLCYLQNPKFPTWVLCGANGVGKDEPPDVTDTPGVRYAVTESDFW